MAKRSDPIVRSVDEIAAAKSMNIVSYPEGVVNSGDKSEAEVHCQRIYMDW